MTLSTEDAVNYDAETNLADYLEFHGWSRRSEGSYGTLWRAGAAGFELAVPRGIRPGTGMWDGTLDMIADLQASTRAVVDKSVRRFWMDVTDFRATSSVVRGDRIAAEAGSSLFSGAWKILRSSATTARGSKIAIAGNYSAPGDKTIQRAMFAQTEPGSYVLPLLVPIQRGMHDSGWGESAQNALMNEDFFQTTGEESDGRRVTRTMAQAMTSVYRTIIEPDREPTAQAINETVIAGASREMVKALYDIVSEETVAGLDMKFTWAPKGGPIASGLTSVGIPKESAFLLKRAFEGMVPSKKQMRTVLSGPILALYHPKGQNFGEATIEAAYRGRIRRVTVPLRGANVLDHAHQWFRAHETLLVTGTVRPTSEGLRIDTPEDLRPVGQTMLFVD
ncbi:hypothetical protein N9A08_15335 [Arthrobacter koreensis]|uniref:Uncharacterized protein n=1 Tax=Arthrobacter koreensis TaxID=199136 RepID=A0ABY6FRX4_9MICC|nr:hypothetical protein [Arthrobacter koreensis]UYB35963.1 hypothetical protein N9A08_15335 [Arthrobacter koreensis]